MNMELPSLVSRKVAIAWLILVVLLSACRGQTEPAPASRPTGPAQAASGPAATVEFPEAVPLENLPQSCQPAGPAEISYQNVDFGYCLLFSSTFEVDDVNPDFVLFQGSPASEGPEPVQALLLIAAGRAANGQSTGDTVDGLVAEVEGLPGLVITRTATTLGGEPAELVEGLPGRTGNQQLYVVHNDRVFQLLAAPLDPAFPQVQAEVEGLWEMARRSFAFLR